METLSAWLELIPPSIRQTVYFLIFNSTWTYVVGEITQNVSQVDRVWTFLPTLYTAYYAFAPYFSWAPEELQKLGPSSRAQLLFAVQFMWMCRLSYNTYRRGLFALSDEDYRWKPLREAMPGILFKLFSLFFIAIAQNIILFIFGLPAYSSLTETSNIPLGFSDFALAGISLTLVALEFVSDNQQYAYQTWKRTSATKVDSSYAWPGARLAFTEADRSRGFITRGLWGWSRHPNFACEQSFWITQTFFPILASPSAFHSHILRSSLKPPYSAFSFFISLPVLPAITVCLLFYSSTLFSEHLSSQKYPAYKAYQKRVGMFFPAETILRGLWLSITGQKKEVDRLTYGDSLVSTKKTQ
ncbi:DUF1295-domain-containing protein [Auriculariales sp. MPI-PUGE-AT-0066]|nr:DUF1295-domain-containing protein [Auriculariales sp. MPI-PUGE-AT-0066]